MPIRKGFTPIEPEIVEEVTEEPMLPEVTTNSDNNGFEFFENPDFGKIRVVIKDDEPWFVGNECGTILGYSNPHKAIRYHVDDEDKRTEQIVHPSGGGNQETILINESGLYSLILRSNLPESKNFKRWVTHEILPSIRKHGVYATDNFLEKTLNDPDFAIGILNKIKEEREQRLLAEKERDEAIRTKAMIGSKREATALRQIQIERGRAMS